MSQKKKNKFWGRRFKTILLRNDTLEEVSTFIFKPIQLVFITLGITIVVVAVTVCIIFYTPARHLVPGYADITENRIYMDLYNRTRKLETVSNQQSLYIDKLQKLMFGDHSGIEDIPYNPSDTNLSKGDIALKVAEDDSLRKKVSVGGQSSLVLPGISSSNSNKGEGLRERTLIAPIKGIISAPYKRTEDHYGIDILAPAETPIKSIDHGVVIAADWTMETGYTIGIQHQDNLISYYKHNSSLLKKAGDIVDAGEAIAIIGNTGHLTSGPHLHFELWYNGNSLDPARYINFEL